MSAGSRSPSIWGEMVKVGGHITRKRKVTLYVSHKIWERRNTSSWREWSWDMQGLSSFVDREPAIYWSGGGWFTPEGMAIVVEERTQ